MSDTFQLKPRRGAAARAAPLHVRRAIRGRALRRSAAHRGAASTSSARRAGSRTPISVPKGTEKNLTVERAAGLEPETGGSG